MSVIKVSLSIGFAGQNITDELVIDQGEWEECQGDEFLQKELINDYFEGWKYGHIESSYKLMEGS